MTDYEHLRESAPEEARIAWRDGARWSSYIQEKDRQLKADQSLSGQGKYEKAEGYRANAEDRIRKGYETARKVLESEAKRKHRASIPLPDNFDLSMVRVKDSAGLLAIQGEAQAIMARVERMGERMPKGMRGSHATDVLRETFASALDDGDIEGMAKARGVLKAAEQLGIPHDEVVAPFRERRHYEAADEALRLENLRGQVPSGKSLPANPFSQQPKSGSDLHTARSNKLLKPKASGVTVPGKSRRQANPWAR